MVNLVEGGSPFRIEGQGHYGAVSIPPLSAFGREEPHVHVRLDLSFGNTVMTGKSQKREEVLGKWTRGALCACATTRLALGYWSGQQVRDLLFKVRDALLQCGDPALYWFRSMSRHLSWFEYFQVTGGNLTAVGQWIAGRKSFRTDRSLDGFGIHPAKLCSSLDADIFTLCHLTSSFLVGDMARAYHVSRQLVQEHEKEGLGEPFAWIPSCPDSLSR